MSGWWLPIVIVRLIARPSPDLRRAESIFFVNEYELERDLEAARARLSELYKAVPVDRSATAAARDAIRSAEIGLARVRGEQYAEPLDLGVSWDAGAPLPVLIADDYRAVVVCYAVDSRPPIAAPRQLQPGSNYFDAGPEAFALIEFKGPVEVRLGGPNEEGLEALDLASRGLRRFEAHVVRNSRWLSERIYLQSKWRASAAQDWDGMQHYFLTFHDSMIEALAWDIVARQFIGRRDEALTEAQRMVFAAS